MCECECAKVRRSAGGGGERACVVGHDIINTDITLET